MPTIAEQNKNDTELMYSLLTEGKLDLMYLPAGAIAWLWDRPKPQVEAARDLAVAAKDICPVTDAAVLRSDQNILILKCEDGHKFNVYPDGGYGCDGEPLDVHGCIHLLDQGMQIMAPEECPMEGGGAPDVGVEFMPPNPAGMQMAEGEQDYWGPKEWREHLKKLLASGASPDEIRAVKDKIRGVSHEHMKPTAPDDPSFNFGEEEGDSVIDRDREDRFVDDLCKTRSLGSDFMKNLKIGEGDMVTGRDSGFSESDVKEQIEQAARQARGYNERAEVVLELLRMAPNTVVNSWRRAGSPYPNTREFVEYLKEYLEVSDEMIAKIQQDNTERNERLYGRRKGVGENEGGQGDAGPIGTDMYDFEDEVAQLGVFVGEELKKYQK